MTQTPRLTFFCELDTPDLQPFFQSSGLIEQLQRLHASVSLGLPDASPDRAQVVRQLNQAGIPVTAWLLLPKDQGYWFNLENAEKAFQRYEQFQAWTELRSLQWAGIGLDIEPDIRTLQTLARDKRAGMQLLLKNLSAKERYRRGTAQYRELVRQIHADGYRVESYQFPLIIDARRTRSHLVQRLTGIADLPVDREIQMLYSSFYPSIGTGLLSSYGPESGGIGLGSTGGGVTMEGLANPAPLGWEPFEADLRLAAQMCPHLYIFSLEGCVQQGFLQRLEDFDWHRPIRTSTGQTRKVKLARGLLRAVLTLSRLFIH